jgi:hypothetical protein
MSEDGDVEIRPSTVSADDTPPKEPLAKPRHGISGWLAKYVLAPLSPFIVGAALRMLHAEAWSVSAFDPGELSFSLAMFCLFVTLSLQRRTELSAKDVLDTFFTIGTLLFIAMFSFSVIQSAELSDHKTSAITNLSDAVKSISLSSQSDITTQVSSLVTKIDTLSKIEEQKTNQRKLNNGIIIIGLAGFCFIVLGTAFQRQYGLSLEQDN